MGISFRGIGYYTVWIAISDVGCGRHPEESFPMTWHESIWRLQQGSLVMINECVVLEIKVLLISFRLVASGSLTV